MNLIRSKGSLLFCSVLCFFYTVTGIAQKSVPPLERKVTLDYRSEKAQQVLLDIERQTGISFSYSSQLVPADKTISVSVINRPVREALDKMFSGRLTYKTRNEHIILSQAPGQPKVIKGYVENGRGEQVSGASVYDRNTMASATTNEYGYFEMKIRRTAPVKLEVSKSNYGDTVVPLNTTPPVIHHIVIEEERDTTIGFVRDVMRTTADSLSAAIDRRDSTTRFVGKVLDETVDSLTEAFKETGRWLRRQLIWNENVKNIRDSLHRPFQISLVPFVGTNGKLSGNVTNDYSWNILAGYNRGVRKAEFAGLLNVDREDVCCAQFSGFSNIVGGNVQGAQFAGFSNIIGGRTEGAQFAGFINIGSGKLSGAQFAGFMNINADTVQGAQFAGFMNINGVYTEGAQFAGFMNLASGGMNGLQMAGFMNIADKKMNGVQVSGFMNVAEQVTGSQIGFLNFADTITGVPVGFLSFVTGGYHKLEFSYDDINYGHLAYRTGVKKFYNIISAGALMDFNTDTVNWTFGYGLGTAPRISERLDLNFDITANQIIHGNVQRPLNQLAKLNAGIDFQLTPNISVFGAVVLNGYFYHNDAELFPGAENIRSVYSDRLNNDYQVDSWIGWRAGIRLF